MPAKTEKQSEDDFSSPSRDKGPWLLRPGNLERAGQIIRFFPTDRQARSLQRAIWKRSCHIIASPIRYARRCEEGPNGLMIPITIEEIEELDFEAIKTPLLAIHDIISTLEDRSELKLILNASRNVAISTIRIGEVWEHRLIPPGYHPEISVGAYIFVNPRDKSRSSVNPDVRSLGPHIFDDQQRKGIFDVQSAIWENTGGRAVADALIRFTDRIIASGT